MSFVYDDFRDRIATDAQAPVLTWRHEHGHRLGHENSSDALAWNLLRTLDRAGALAQTWSSLVGRAVPHLEVYYWGRTPQAEPFAPLAEARAELERHLRGPDLAAGDADAALVCAPTKTLWLVNLHILAPLTNNPPLWFRAARTPIEQRSRKAAIVALLAQEPDAQVPFRRGLAIAMQRGFYRMARHLLVARATAKRLGADWSAYLTSLVCRAAPNWNEDAGAFSRLLHGSAKDAHKTILTTGLATAAPANVRPAVAAILRSATANRVHLFDSIA